MRGNKYRLFLLCLLWCATAAAQETETPAPGDFRDERIYSVITSRFFDADEENNYYNYERIEKGDPHYRGDFKGLAQKLDYIKELGFTAICITPPVENRGGLDFMGFNSYDWETFEPRLSSHDFSYADLIKSAHSKGLKIIQTLVVNHCANFGIRNHYFIPRLPLKFYRGPLKPSWPYIFNFGDYKHEFRMNNDNPCAPEWFKDYRFRDQWGAGPLKDPVTGATFPAADLHPERFFSTSEGDLHPDWFHREGWLNTAENMTVNRVQRAHLDANSIDLATDNWHIKRFFAGIVKKYIDLGVDGLRIQFARNSDRNDLLHMIGLWREFKPELYIFADVAPVLDGFGKLTGDEPTELVPWWYTRKTPDPFEPEIGGASGLAVMDYPLFKTFAANLAMGHFSGIGNIIKNDWLYADPNTLVSFFHNYDIGPETSNLTRFSGETWKTACAYNLMWTLRGVPMLLMGEEIEFMKGMPQICVLPADVLSQTGKAYFGDNLSDANIGQTSAHTLAQHVKRLNQIRSAVPALCRGNMENGNEFVSGISFVRNYNNGESYAVIGLTAFIDQDISVTRVLPGNYIDAITGESLQVATDSRTLNFSVKANSAGIWVLDGPGKVGTDGDFLR